MQDFTSLFAPVDEYIGRNPDIVSSFGDDINALMEGAVNATIMDSVYVQVYAPIATILIRIDQYGPRNFIGDSDRIRTDTYVRKVLRDYQYDDSTNYLFDLITQRSFVFRGVTSPFRNIDIKPNQCGKITVQIEVVNGKSKPFMAQEPITENIPVRGLWTLPSYEKITPINSFQPLLSPIEGSDLAQLEDEDIPAYIGRLITESYGLPRYDVSCEAYTNLYGADVSLDFRGLVIDKTALIQSYLSPYQYADPISTTILQTLDRLTISVGAFSLQAPVTIQTSMILYRGTILLSQSMRERFKTEKSQIIVDIMI